MNGFFSQIGGALSGLGGLLGFGGNPQMPPPGPEYYAEGAAAGAATNPPQAPRPDPFAQYTPEQRRQLGLAYLTDTAAQLGGRESNSAQSLMRAFNARSGGGPVLPQMQAPQAMQVAPMMQLQAPPMRMPQQQMGMQRPGVSSYLLGV